MKERILSIVWNGIYCGDVGQELPKAHPPHIGTMEKGVSPVRQTHDQRTELAAAVSQPLPAEAVWRVTALAVQFWTAEDLPEEVRQ